MTDLGNIDLSSGYNQPGMGAIRESTNGEFDVYVNECDSIINAQVIYQLNSKLRVTQVFFTDQFNKRREELIRQGRLQAISWDEYASHIRDAVLHWTDSGWVSERRLRSAKP